jgi:hypothetical protein
MNQIRKIIAGAIQRAFIDYPMRNDGTRWDQQYKSDEESELLGNAVLMALKNSAAAIARRHKPMVAIQTDRANDPKRTGSSLRLVRSALSPVA